MSSRPHASTPQPLRPQPASTPDESTVAARQAAFRARLRGADVHAPAPPEPSPAVPSSPSPVGRTVDKSGYALVRAPRHPHCNSGGYVREHRLVMEQVIGRYLLPDEVVTHLDGNKANNNPANLKLYASNSAHKVDQLRGNSHALGDTGNPRRSHRTMRGPDEILAALRLLAESLERPIRRADLVPPWPSHKAVGRAFGSWQQGVRLALAERPRKLRVI